MNQKTDFEKYLENSNKQAKELLKLENEISEVRKAGFNVLSDRELEEMLAEFATRHTCSYGQQINKKSVLADVKQWFAKWKEKRRNG